MIAQKPTDTPNITDTVLELITQKRGQPVTERDRQLFLTIRQASIMMIGAIEDHLGMERSIPPKHKR